MSNTTDQVLEEARKTGYLTVTDTATTMGAEASQQARDIWMTERLSQRLPYIEICYRAHDQAILGYSTQRVPIASKPARELIKRVSDQIAKMQRTAGFAVGCRFSQPESYRGSIGELPISTAREIADAINDMAPTARKSA